MESLKHSRALKYAFLLPFKLATSEPALTTKVDAQDRQMASMPYLHASSCTVDAGNACARLSGYMHALSAGQQSV